MDYLKVSNPAFKGIAQELETKTIDEKTGVKALYSRDKKKIKTFLFDKTLWTEKEAQDYVEQHFTETTVTQTKAHIERTEKGMLAIASNAVEDRDGEVISVDGWELENYKKNPILLWLHNRAPNHDGRPIGRAESIGYKTIDGQKHLVFKPEFDDTTEFNSTTKKMVEKGLLNMFSVGFLPKERNDNIYTKQELLEISLVPVPSNSTATFIQRSKELGFDEKIVKEFIKNNDAIPYRSYDPAPESKIWNANAAVSRLKEICNTPEGTDLKKYKEGFAWHDSTNEEKLSSYKLAHHDIVGGEIVTVWKGVVAAMSVLLGAKGGIDLPDTDKKKVYDHLASHYKQFGKVAPDYKFVETQELKDIFDVHGEVIEQKAFSEFKNIMRHTREMVKEMKKDKLAHEKKVDKVDSKLALTLEILKGISKNVTASLKGDINLIRKESKNES